MILAARCGEVLRLAPTGVGGGVPDRLLTAALVAATAAVAAAPASTRRAWVDRSPRIILGHVLVKYAIRLWRVGHFAETYDVDGEVRRKYDFNSFRKNNLTRLRKFLNEAVVDQIPLLTELQRRGDRAHHLEVDERNALLENCDASSQAQV